MSSLYPNQTSEIDEVKTEPDDNSLFTTDEDEESKTRASNFQLQSTIAGLQCRKDLLEKEKLQLATTLSDLAGTARLLRSRHGELTQLTRKQDDDMQGGVTYESWWKTTERRLKDAMSDLERAQKRANEIEELRQVESKERLRLEGRVKDVEQTLVQISKVVSATGVPIGA